MTSAERLVNRFIAHRLMVFLFCGLLLVAGAWSFRHLPIEAYPNIAPLNVQLITQWAGRSTLEIERQLTIPIETAVSGVADAVSVRSVSLFGLSTVTVQFKEGTDSFHARQDVDTALHGVNLPSGVQPAMGPDADATGEILRYRVTTTNPDVDLIELKSLQDWEVFKALKSVPGVADVNGFGGLVQQYQVLPDPARLQAYNLTLAQVAQAVTNGNGNVGGGLVPAGEQQLVVRGVGLVAGVDDIRRVPVAVVQGAPVRVGDVADVHEGFAPRLGQVQFNHQAETVEGIVVQRRNQNASEVLDGVRTRIDELNHSGRLPPGTRVRPFYDRQELLDLTVHTVSHTLLFGITLVLVVLFLFLGNLRTAFAVAATIPLSLCVSFMGMHLLHVPANLISLGAIDFGLVVNAAVIVTENIMQQLEQRKRRPRAVFMSATAEVMRSMAFSTAIIVVAYTPLFLLGGVEGEIFEPMAFTMGLALLGSVVLSVTFIPAFAATLFGRGLVVTSPRAIDWMQERYRRLLCRLIRYPVRTGLVSLVILVGAGFVGAHLGTSFLPTLEENNLWIRVTLPNTVDLEYSASLASRIRERILQEPEVRDVSAQIGRPDDGTDSTGVFNQEFGVYFKAPAELGRRIDRQAVIDRLQSYFAGIPAVDVNFSQYIQDNVDEALSGVKGENSVKLFGDDLAVLANKAAQIEHDLSEVPGIVDVGTFKELGQPTLNLEVDRTAAQRFGINVADVENMVLNAVGGNAVTQVQEGERLVDLVLRLPSASRSDVESMRRLLVDCPDGSRVPLSMVARVAVEDGPFFIYREGARRFIAIKFGVRGRDLGSAVHAAQSLIAADVDLPRGYTLSWEGQFNEMRVAQQKLVVIVPMVLFAIYVLLTITFNSARDAGLVLMNSPFAAIGGVLALALAHEDLSISAGIGFLSLFGIAIQNVVILITSVRQLGRYGDVPIEQAVVDGACQRFRSVVMTALLASLGLAPAAFSHAIGSQAQRPLALVIFGGMLSTAFLTLLVLPVAYARVNRARPLQAVAQGPLPDRA